MPRTLYPPAVRLVVLLFSPLLHWSAGAQPLPPLNDTGQSLCVDAARQLVPCTAASAGDGAPYQGQDGRHGRDAVPGIAKVGAGEAGFDYTRLCWNGAAEGSALCTGPLVANITSTPGATPETDWACTRDNVTGLTWSLQTQADVTWNAANAPGFGDAGHSTPGRCGFADWRMPSLRELRSILHYGRPNPSIAPAHFPATVSDYYWTSDTYTASTASAWATHFLNGDSGFLVKGGRLHARLVRHAP